jgi:hypothetical protein
MTTQQNKPSKRELMNKNALLNKFHHYDKHVPFQNNQLIENNIHVLNNLNKIVKGQNINNEEKKNINIIEHILTPQKVNYNNTDINTNLKIKEQQRKEKIELTNIPYKPIIRDHPINKPITCPKDLAIYEVNKKDADIEIFNSILNNKKKEYSIIDEELKTEYCLDNYSKHKQNFEYKETFITNLAYEDNTYDESKRDYLDFYRTKQKEIEEGKKICDEILHIINNEGIVNKEELPIKSQEEMTKYFNNTSL